MTVGGLSTMHVGLNRLLTALLLLVWTASVGRCLAEQYGLLHEAPGLECCDHGHESEPLSHSDSAPCGICHMIEHSGVSLAKPVVLRTLALLPVAETTPPNRDWLPVALPLREAAVWTRPPIPQGWGAFLISICLPVRGPNRIC